MTQALLLLPSPDSLLARLDPRWKLAAVGLSTAAAALLQTLPAALAALAGALLLALLARVPVRWYLARLGAVGIFLLVVLMTLPFLIPRGEPTWHLGPLTASWGGLRLALVLTAKAVTILTLALALLVSTPLNVLLSAAHALRMPGVLVQLAMLSYRYLFVLGAELGRLRIALRVRGYRNRATRHSYRTVGHVAGALLVRSYERAERVGQAMRCRGFAGHYHALTRFRTTTSDVTAFLVVVAAAVGLAAWDVVRRG